MNDLLSSKSFDELSLSLSETGIYLREEPSSDLVMFRHQQSARSTPDSDLLNSTKGLIISKKTMEVVAPHVPIPIDLESEMGAALAAEALKAPRSVQEIYDGVMFRIYHHNDSWHCSTNGMVKPNKGWNGKRTFMDMMSECDLDYSLLHKDYCYYVVMIHPDHHNVVKYSEKKLILTQLMHRTSTGAWEEVEINLELGDSNLKDPTVKFKADEPFLESPEMTAAGVKPEPVSFVGYLVIDKEGRRFRFESENYKKAKSLRGNNPDPKKLWVNLRKEPERLEVYLAYFPEVRDEFALMSRKFDDLVKTFFSQYGMRFKQRKYVVHHSRHVKSLNELHQVYVRRREAGMDNEAARITEDDVREFLNTKPDAELFYLINPYNVPTSYAATNGRMVLE